MKIVVIDHLAQKKAFSPQSIVMVPRVEVTTTPLASSSLARPIIANNIIIVVIVVAVLTCTHSIYLLFHGLLLDGPAFYHGQECHMTYSQYKFLPLRVVSSPLSPPATTTTTTANSDDDDDGDRGATKDFHKERYRLLKFTDARDPRHTHLYPISGTWIEDYNTQQKKRPRSLLYKKENEPPQQGGRLLKMSDNWCLLPSNVILGERDNSTATISKTKKESSEWAGAPYPNQGHSVLYVPGHWGSYSQARSLGAHGTRYTGTTYSNDDGKLVLDTRRIYESLLTGRGMHNGLGIRRPPRQQRRQMYNLTKEEEEGKAFSSGPEEEEEEIEEDRHVLNGFVMDIYSLDLDGQGGHYTHIYYSDRHGTLHVL